MKNTRKCTGIAALVAAVGFITLSLTGCGNGSTGDTDKDLSGTIAISPDSAEVGTELTATYSGSENVSYQWKKDGGNVGANADT